MKILVDENIDEAFPKYLDEHNASHVNGMGWQGMLNGALLARAVENGFKALISSDKNMAHQQNMKERALFLVVLDIHPNVLENQIACIPVIQELLKSAESGQVYVIEGPHPKRQKR